MGDDFLLMRDEQSKRQREKKHEAEFSQSTLFSNAPTGVTHIVKFTAPGVGVQPGDEVWMADIEGKQLIRVMYRTTAIGEVDEAGSARIRSLLSQLKEGRGVLMGIVTKAEDISGYTQARLGPK